MSHVANLDSERQYLGARNRKLRIFPGSGLSKKSPKWIVAAEIAETSQLFARCVAKIEPQWLQGINDRLLKRSGRIMAFEKITLFGLTISDRQRVHGCDLNLM